MIRKYLNAYLHFLLFLKTDETAKVTKIIKYKDYKMP